MKKSVVTYKKLTILACLFCSLSFFVVADFAEAVSSSTAHTPSVIGRRGISHNRYENQRIKFKRAMRRWEHKQAMREYKKALKKQRELARKKKQQEKIRARRLKAQHKRQMQLAKLQNRKHNSLKARQANGRLSYNNKAAKEGALANNGKVKNSTQSTPSNLTLVQRLRYAFTGRY